MPGLIDSTTGLEEGTGLQFQTAIGGAGLTIISGSPPDTGAILLQDNTNLLLQDGTNLDLQ